MKKVLTALTALGPMFGKEITRGLLNSYSLALAEYPEDKLLACIPKLAQGKFFPRAYDFIQLIEGEKPDPQALANQRWTEILSHVWHKTPFPSDPIAVRAFRGVADVHMVKIATENTLKGYGFSFRNSYEAELIRTRNDVARLPGEECPVLPGDAMPAGQSNEDEPNPVDQAEEDSGPRKVPDYVEKWKKETMKWN